MSDFGTIIKGLACCVNGLNHEPRCEECPYADEQEVCDGLDQLHQGALDLLKEQDAVIDALLKVGYPHDFQNEEPWVVNYMWAITDVVRKAVRLRNAKGAKVDG